MDYWIDGYNLLFKVKAHLHDLQQTRESLIQELKLHLIKSNIRATIIFDSSEEHSSDFPNSHSKTPLEIQFSPKGLTADEYIIEKLNSHPSAKNTTVVTNDAPLAFNCRQARAKTISVDEFFDLIFKKERQRDLSDYEFMKEEGVEFEESEENIQMFVKIFENRLNKDS